MRGLSAREHAVKTITHLMRLLPPKHRVKRQIIVLSGERTTFRHDTDRELPFRQESNFYYLSGCDVPNSALLLSYDTEHHKLHTTLFIPPEDPLEVLWSPAPPTVEAAARAHETDVVLHTTQFASVYEQAGAGDALVHVLPPAPEPFPSHRLFDPSGATHKYLLPALHAARLIKTDAELALIRHANDISSRAHEVVMRLLGIGVRSPPQAPCMTVKLPGDWLIEKESEAEAVFVASCRREGAHHQAYLPIVAASVRASTLHYCCNDREFAWGPAPTQNGDARLVGDAHAHHAILPQVLLIDAGCEYRNYASDITRTMPVGNGGKFTPEARAIYSLVLKMQEDSIAILKPGLHWDDVQLLCHQTLIRGFLELGIFKGTEADILASGASAAFFPHGVGHSLGLDVHDVPSASKPEKNSTIPARSAENPSFYTYLRLRLPLAAGMVVTVEPGIYFSPHQLAPVRQSSYIDHVVLERYEAVGGVRIEDVVAITETGCDVITSVGKEVKWIEKVCSGEA